MNLEPAIKSKKEDEDDDPAFNLKIVELLKAKVKLDNGEEGYVFTKNTDEHPRGRFRCHVCNVPIGSTKSLEEHASGKNHSRKMQANFHSHENFSKIVLKESSKLSTDVGGKVIKAPGVDIPDLAPGEPVPPGFEDVVTRVPEITATLDEMKAPLIGLEYLAEITPVGDEVEPKYCCLLCNKRGDPRTVLAHLVCFNHRIKYIGRYFPRTNTALALIPKVKEYKRGTGEVLAKIVKAIENKFGRLNPVIVDGTIFDQKKEEYYREMSNGRHFYETADSNYEMLVDIDFIKKCGPEGDGVLTIDIEKEEAKKKSTTLKNEMNKFKQKNSLPDQDKIEKKTFDRRLQQVSNAKPKREKSVETISSSGSRSYSRSRSRSYSRIRSRSRSRSGSFSKSHSRSRLPYRHSRKDYDHGIRRRSRSPRYYYRSRSRSRSLSRTRYRSRSRSRGSSYKRFRSSTYRTKSPTYERTSYRTIRYDSLYNGEDNNLSDRPKSIQVKVAELRDKRRKRDLFAEYVEKLEKDMAKTLKSYNKNPEMHPLYPEEWKKFWNRRYKELTSEGIDASKHDFKPEWIKFWLVRMKELHNEEFEMKKEKYRIELGLNEKEKSPGIDSDVIEVSPTPLEDDKSNVTVDDIKNTWKALTGSEIKSAKEKSPEKKDLGKSLEAELDEPVRVITVLRLLTALESQLGSLGPRVNNLLSQAIALEKKKIGSSDSLIEVSENSVLFETVKEKLKGQLFAGIVEKHTVSATRTAIQNVAELFNSWKSKKNNVETVTISAPASITATVTAAASEPLIVPGIGAIDKVSIAQQIAAALIAQGKSNVTEQELEQLINAVVGMAQATTRSTTVPPTVSVASYSTTTPLPTVATTCISSSGLQSEQDVEEKPSVLQQLVSSVSKFSWGSSNSGTKVLTNFDDTSSLSLRSRLLPKINGDLPEEDMKTLLQNFRDLTEQEQQSLITYLKELEGKDPESVEKLRKFVVSASENKMDNKKEDSGRLSPFSMREGGANPSIEDGSKLPTINSKELDEDEDDYSYEDIYKAAEKKVSGKSVVEQMIEEQQKKVKLFQSQVSPFSDKSFSRDSTTTSSKVSDDPEYVLNDAKVTIDNIMGQLPSKFTGGASRITTPKNYSKPPAPVEPPPAYSPALLYNNSSNPPSDKIPNNLLNDYNYQDDIFTYSNESFQNYPVEDGYHVDSNPNDNYNMQQSMYSGYPNVEQNYNSYEPWNDNYPQYAPPPQQEPIGYHPSQPPPPIINPDFGPPVPYQGQPNEYNGPPLYNAYPEYY